MVKHKIATLAIIALPLLSLAQNNEQKQDTLLNYTDINGLKQGHWIKKHKNGNIQYEAYFIDGKPIGDFKRYDSSGDLYAYLIYDSDGIHAKVTFYHKSGKVCATGKYADHEKDSIWLYYSDSGILFLQESYKNGVKDGTFINYTSDRTKLEEVTWKNGVKEGPWKKYYVNGNPIFEVNYTDGKLNGEGRSYYENGKLNKKGKYVNGLMEGSWLIFDSHGNYQKQYVYKHGYCEELAEEQNKLINELESHKGEIEGPEEHLDDPTWFMR